ncbi:Pyrroline-5-carboxylate reductase [Candidatus Burkholderia humilis]|nr:Pyrroline-5-carboxylate reductase [Candidatus Burkholderia humilis]
MLGVGDLTEKMIRGLHRAKSDIRVVMSPRNRERVERLTHELGYEAMPTNQAVADAADVVLIGVRPANLNAFAEEVTLKPGQALISVVAGAYRWANSRNASARGRSAGAMLSQASEINRSTVAVFPAQSMATQLLASLGNLVPVESKRKFEMAMVAACANGWFYFLIDELQRWFMRHGMSEDTAKNLALSSVEDCVAYSRFKASSSPGEIGESFTLPGTYTWNGLDVLKARGANAAWSEASDRVFEALMRSGTTRR